jgi:hypothetical protein
MLPTLELERMVRDYLPCLGTKLNADPLSPQHVVFRCAEMSLNLTTVDVAMFDCFGVPADLLECAGVHRVTDAEARRELV